MVASNGGGADNSALLAAEDEQASAGTTAFSPPEYGDLKMGFGRSKVQFKVFRLHLSSSFR